MICGYGSVFFNGVRPQIFFIPYQRRIWFWHPYCDSDFRCFQMKNQSFLGIQSYLYIWLEVSRFSSIPMAALLWNIILMIASPRVLGLLPKFGILKSCGLSAIIWFFIDNIRQCSISVLYTIPDWITDDHRCKIHHLPRTYFARMILYVWWI